MRLIDADELKEDIKEWRYHGYYDKLIELIDNAPTVEPEPYFEKAEKDKRIYEQGFKDGQNIRPQGEWNYIQAGMAVCPFCGASPHKDFCPNCGAQMKTRTDAD